MPCVLVLYVPHSSLHAELGTSDLTAAVNIKHNRAAGWQKGHASHAGA